ncbi:trimeric intracellular cation channel family protein [Candidatus Sororendozoicomonas aggregata]|uniref:trimeric intracellular cation channel family protein n=1 Tax=Candidatus Sororendozoicomonas aggregata TaxID=3073239 RepID=UPI002ED60CB8
MLLTVLYIIAITAEAMSGALSAGRKNMDPVGVVFIACITAIGGGSVRDMLLGSYPLTWVAHPEYVVIIVVTALITMLISQYMGKKVMKLFILLDAAGLITFSIIGAQKTLDLGHGYVIASIMAVMTGVFGGVLRDILCNDVPLVFKQELYASVSLVAGALYFCLLTVGLSQLIVVLITLVTGFTLRMLAVQFKLELPKFRYEGSAH